VRWAELEAEQPRLAELGRRKLTEPGVVLVATIRRDGSPRLSPIEPLIWEGEYKLRGRAVAEPSEDVQARFAAVVAEQLGWTPEVGRFHLFRVEVKDIAFIRRQASAARRASRSSAPNTTRLRVAT
jgi:hypothetical protein